MIAHPRPTLPRLAQRRQLGALVGRPAGGHVTLLLQVGPLGRLQGTVGRHLQTLLPGVCCGSSSTLVVLLLGRLAHAVLLCCAAVEAPAGALPSCRVQAGGSNVVRAVHVGCICTCASRTSCLARLSIGQVHACGAHHHAGLQKVAALRSWPLRWHWHKPASRAGQHGGRHERLWTSAPVQQRARRGIAHGREGTGRHATPAQLHWSAARQQRGCGQAASWVPAACGAGARVAQPRLASSAQDLMHAGLAEPALAARSACKA